MKKLFAVLILSTFTFGTFVATASPMQPDTTKTKKTTKTKDTLIVKKKDTTIIKTTKTKTKTDTLKKP
jgi:hypothetical protein